MAALKTVWGIDIGQCGLKALKLREVDGQLQAEAFDILEHPKILSQPDADRPQLIRNALEQFLARNDLSNSLVAVSVPGQNSFTRFVKLPPVETKRIPSIVRFEAEQQIPFDINEVIWRWQSFPDPDSPDIEVGLFAMKRVDVYGVLDAFREVAVNVDIVQMAPLALYNFMTYDQQVAADGATLLVDVGAESTNLVIADGPRLWTRTIQLGGNNFTEALVKSFKLSFSKAEKLKRTAATSKYARQIFQSMRPVFADLVQEIQRSIGYYTSLHRETRFRRLLGLGSGFRLPGLQKFIEQNLNIPVVRVDSYNALQPSATISAPTFTENVLSFAVAYGLALQGLELTRINTNLLPDEISSQRRWSKKRGWFAAAAVLLIAATAGLTFRAFKDQSILANENNPELNAAQEMVGKYQGLRSQYNQISSAAGGVAGTAGAVLKAEGYRSFWPDFMHVVSESVRASFPQQVLQTGAPQNIQALKSIPAAQWKLITVTGFEANYFDDLRASGATAADLQRLYRGRISAMVGGGMLGFPMGMPYGGGGGTGDEYTGPPVGAYTGPPMGYPGAETGPPMGPNVGYGTAALSGPPQRGYHVLLFGTTPMGKAALAPALSNLLLASKNMVAGSPLKGEMSIVATDLINIVTPTVAVAGMPGAIPLSPTPGYPSPADGESAPVAANPGYPMGMTGPVDATGRSTINDNQFLIGWVLQIMGDGLPVAP